ncbi:MAG TPA: DUF3300 domain-containing protein [Bryobacteraceae bacterium]|nr:DUF3300 domain-containing protein [Bryobacteraceae bacterium]
MKRWNRQSILRSVAAALVLLTPFRAVFAQDAQPAPRTVLSAQQLDNLVAPLALYPDPLLSQVLVAATYPLELVQANQWLQQNRHLTGTALMDAAKQQNWDPSVQALVAFPDVLARLNQDVQWTTDLGNAFLAQQADVMAAIQRLRARAQANGKLQTTPQQTVSNQTQDGQPAITIQPADPQVIYVPTYDPAYIWGAPAWGYYPPLFYPSYGFGFGFGIPIGGFFLGWGGWGGWGWGFNWWGHSCYVNGGFFHGYGYHYGGYGHAGFNGTRAWAHDYARTAHAGGAPGYSRSYGTAGGATAGGSRAGTGAGFRSPGAGQGNRSVASNSYANRGASGNSRSYAAPAQRASSAAAQRSYSAPARSYSAPAQRSYGSVSRSYSAPSRSYSAPSRSYAAPSRSYSAPRSSGGGGGGFHGGGGSHGGHR